MSLEQKLAEIREGSKDRIPVDVLSEMHRATEELKSTGIEGRALAAGAIMPSFSLPNTEGNIVASTRLLGSGPLIVTFYRGVW